MSTQTLPIDSFLPEITLATRDYSSVILMAEPGAGKTTRVPVALTQANASRWIVLQPRRWAAKLTATRIAEENHWTLGQEVGFQVRFENKTSKNTRIVLMTEGILVRRLIENPELEGFAGVILDEFHERSLDLDLSLALLKEIQGSFRPDLKIIVMSATLDPKPLQKFLPNSKVFEIPGRTFPVVKKYFDSEEVVAAVREYLPNTGDVLVFLPGSFEIEKAVSNIQNMLQSFGNSKFIVLPLYAALPEEKQKLVFSKTERQKIICSTNIAETSLTLPNVKVVIDSGLSKVMRMDPQLGIDKLETLRISRAASEQRAGRAGRVSEGLCVRLWSEGEQIALRHFETPEIHRVNLGRAILTLTEFGVTDFSGFDWFEKPKSSMLKFALDELHHLKFLEKGKRTELGSEALKLPLEPKIAAIMLAAKKENCSHFGARFCAFLENLSNREVMRDEEKLISRLNQLSSLEQKTAEQLLGTKSISKLSFQDWPKFESVLIESGRGGLVIQGRRVGRRKVVAKDGALPQACILLSALDKGEVQALSWIPISLKTLENYAEKKRKAFWDEDLKRVRALEGMFFEDLEIGKLTEVAVSPDEASDALKGVLLQDPETLFSKDEGFASFLKRVALYHEFKRDDHPSIPLPWEDFVEVLVQGKTRLDAVFQENLVEKIESLIPRSALQILSECAPFKIEVPSGSLIKIDYDSSPPKLSVRLQEVFGWLETPRLFHGKVPLLMELLSPSFKPIQVTQDLKSFWSGAYFEVKKELKARYPKHAWPEDPLTAKPEAKGRGRR